jgi:hypothetical protein
VTEDTIRRAAMALHLIIVALWVCFVIGLGVYALVYWGLRWMT